MDIRYSPFNITSAVALGLTVWLFVARFRTRLDSNWPLFYYLGLVIYGHLFPGNLDPAWIYAGVVSALFLRFEFMGGWFLKLIRGVELIVLLYVIHRLIYIIRI